MDYKSIIEKRYACRNYNGEIVNNEDINIILESGNKSQTALNLQQHCFGVIKNKKKINEVIKATYNQNYLSNASHIIILFAKMENIVGFNSEYTKKIFASRVTEDRPLSYFIDTYKKMLEKKTVKQYSIEQVHITASHLVNMATDLGVRSNIIGAFDPIKINKIFKLDENDYYPALIIALGYSNEEIPKKSRLDIKENILFNIE